MQVTDRSFRSVAVKSFLSSLVIFLLMTGNAGFSEESGCLVAHQPGSVIVDSCLKLLSRDQSPHIRSLALNRLSQYYCLTGNSDSLDWLQHHYGRSQWECPLGGEWYIQLGLFRSRENALQFLSAHAALPLELAIDERNDDLLLVRSQYFQGKKEARRMARNLKTQGLIQDYMIKRIKL